ncbi:UNVERIFIED_CONTAM: Transposon Ty3-G Gag-Pol polyprotein [Sesamum calycinum]|uniref:Transposon Ty3-G Gag-Pol polyprotein n=1 Tax=Sesamum calycinum TaxID=2727403 RepID=A0AAW2QZ56_9LAMI
MLREGLTANTDIASSRMVQPPQSEKGGPQNDTMNNGSQGTYSTYSKQLKFPKFNGEEPRQWIRRCNRYFNIANTITDDQKVQVASVQQEGRAETWYEGLMERKEVANWNNFVEAILGRFDDIDPECMVQHIMTMSEEEEQEYLREIGEETTNGDEDEPGEDVPVYVNVMNSSVNMYTFKINGKTYVEARIHNPDARGDWLRKQGSVEYDYEDMKVTVARDGKRLILKALTKATTHHAELQMISAKSVERLILGRNYKLMGQLSVVNIGREKQIRTDTVLEEILEEFNDVFQEPTELPPKRMIEHQIDLYPGAIPNKQTPYRYTHAQKAEIKTLVKEMLEARIIRPSQSSFSSLILLDKNKNGTWRMCMDYRYLNKLTVKHDFPIPVIDELLDKLHGSYYFSKIDLRSEYFQIRMKQHDVYKNQFFYPSRALQIPATGRTSYTPENSLELTKTNKLYAKRNKCSFGKKSVEYFGHVISAEGIATDPSKFVDEWEKGIGAVLMQEARPISCLSKALGVKNLGLTDKKSYTSDAKFQNIFQAKVIDKDTYLEYSILNGILRKGTRVCVGKQEDLRKHIIQAFAQFYGGRIFWQTPVQVRKNLKLAPKTHPIKILARMMIPRNNAPVAQILIQWEGFEEDQATWEDYYQIQKQLPDFELSPRDQGSQKERRNVTFATAGADFVVTTFARTGP